MRIIRFAYLDASANCFCGELAATRYNDANGRFALSEHLVP